jgi:hypothetical protein
MRFVDRIEEDTLQIAGRVGPQRSADAGHRQRQAADEIETRFGVPLVHATSQAVH